MISFDDLQQKANSIWEIPKSFRRDMRCAARIYATEEGVRKALEEASIEQLINTASLPGVEYAAAMPDVHQGYGFPIGGVAAIRTKDGVISPGGVGYDINCGVRTLASRLTLQDLKPHVEKLLGLLQANVPTGVGQGGSLRLNKGELRSVLQLGAAWPVREGFGTASDLEFLENNGCLRETSAECVSEMAIKRGQDQLGTLGSGNHFLEVQEVVDILESDIADAFGFFPKQVLIMIHTGSRGLGHQVCTDYVKAMGKAQQRYGIRVKDRELACAPFRAPEGQMYYQAMCAAANFAWANRQVISHFVREAFAETLGHSQEAALRTVYDVAHNIAKREKHNGTEYIVHRKGATRAFGPNSKEIPERYRPHGQPVLIPGSMGTCSYILAGTDIAMEESFGSSCHGAGRSMSRMKAKKTLSYQSVHEELIAQGIRVQAGSKKGFLEEAPAAYKDVDEVIKAISQAELAKPVAKLKPLLVLKG